MYEEGVKMKYDDLEKIECNSYPNLNVVLEKNRVKPKMKIELKGKTFDTVLGGVMYMASFAVVLLATSMISLAASGNLVSTFMSVFS